MIDSLEADTIALVDAAWRRGLALDRQMTISAWADAHRILPGSNAEPGPWRTARVPYLREIMDTLSNGSAVERVVFMKGAQIGATEAGLNAIGYWVDHAPGVILVVWPSLDMLRRNSRSRIEPMIVATPALRGKIAEARSRDSGNTIGMKEFPGGAMILTGANSATGLRSTAARYLILDEVDAFPADADGEGDPVQLAVQRTVTFSGRRKIFLISTPTIAGVSRIEKAYEESDKRLYFVPCPHCGHHQVLVWRQVKFPAGEPRKAFYVCEDQGCIIEEHDKPAMLAGGEWRATAAGDGRTAGFHLSSLYSPFEPWGEIAADFLAAGQDPERLKAWTNLKLGEPFEDRDTAPLSPDTLQSRGEYSEHPWHKLLPPGVLVITAGVDVQDDRLEVEFVGWGLGEESWSLDYRILPGRTDLPDVWRHLDELLARRFRHPANVADLPVAATTVDSGGHRTSEVMAFSAARLNRRVWAIKGRGGPGVPQWPHRPPKLRPGSIAPLHIVGIDAVKFTLMARLRRWEKDDGASGPGVCHFPADRDYYWFAGIVAERAIRKYIRGVARLEWIADPGVRNEPLDCRVYATAALKGLVVNGLELEREAARIGATGFKDSPMGETVAPVLTAPMVVKSKFMGDRR